MKIKHFFGNVTKKRVIILTVLITFISAALPQYAAADIDSFVTDIKTNEKKTDSDKPETDKKQKSPRHNKDTDNIFMQLLSILWLYNNLSVNFNRYPYSDYGKYILLNGRGQSIRGSATTEMLYDNNLEFGNRTRFEGNWKFIGPYLQNTVMYDGTSLLGNFQLGGQFSLIQTNPFSFFITGGWSHWYGELEYNTSVVGIMVRSYPFRPLSLEWRYNCHSFNGTYLNASALEAGLCFNRIEYYIVWNNLSLYKDSEEINSSEVDDILLRESNGVSAGIRLYF